MAAMPWPFFTCGQYVGMVMRDEGVHAVSIASRKAQRRQRIILCRLFLGKRSTLEVTYELTADDLWRFNQYYLRHKTPYKAILITNPSLITKIGFALLCFGILVEIGDSVIAVLQHHSPDWAMLVCFAVLAIVIPTLLPPSKKRIAKAASKQPGFLCEHVTTISPEWFAERTFVNETKIAWTTILSLEDDQSYFFFLSKNIGFIIPKRAFSSPAEADAFLNMARRYWDAAKTRTPPTAEDTAIWPPAPRPGA